MADPKFNILQKPPPDDDKKGWYRFHYKVCEILNNLLNTLPAWVFTVLTWPFTFTTPVQGDLITYDDASGQWINSRKIGTLTSYTEFEDDGTMVAVGDASTWNDINISMNSMANTGATILDILTIGGNKFKAFIGTGGSTQQVDGSLEILHDYKEGSDITPHIHWMPEDANTGNVKFTLGYRWWNGGGTMPAETLLSITIAAGGVQYQEKRSNFATISGAGMTMGSRFVFRIFRDPTDAADTYTHYAIGLDFGIHYEKDTTGSRQVTTK